MDTTKLEMTVKDAVALVQAQLPVLEAFLPAVAGASPQIALGIAAANALIPLIQNIAPGEEVSVAEQLELLSRVQALIDGKQFDAPEWKQSSTQ